MRWWDFWFAWRVAREPSVREASFDQRPPTLRGHTLWMLRWLTSLTRHAWLITEDGKRCGIIRAAEADPGAILSIALLPEARGRGLASNALRIICWRLERWGIRPLVAEIKPGNLASLNAFAAVGFKVLSYSKPWHEVIILQWRKPR